MGPGLGDILGALDIGLALAGRGHDRLDEAGIAHRFGTGGQFVGAASKGKGTGRKAQLFSRQATYALAVHGQLGGAGGGHHAGHAGVLDHGQNIGGDGLDLGHDDVRPLGHDDPVQHLGIGHRDDVAAVRHLHGRGIGIAIHRHHLDPQALQLDGHLLAQLARAQKHDADGGVGKRGAETHGWAPVILLPLREKAGRRGDPDEGYRRRA